MHCEDGAPQANMTAFTAAGNVKVLSLERFRDAVTDTTCSATSIELTLEKEIKFDQLQASWAWVNEVEHNRIVFVTDECPEYDDEGVGKQTWHVTSIAFDDANNVATLSATPVPWEDAFHNWHLRVSSTGLLPSQDGDLAARGIDQGSISLATDFSSTPYPRLHRRRTHNRLQPVRNHRRSQLRLRHHSRRHQPYRQRRREAQRLRRRSHRRACH